MSNYKTKLLPGHLYHIYSRANGGEQLFPIRENYRYFLEKYKRYIVPIADTYCYCLMPNHFHFLIRFKAAEKLDVPENISNISNFISSRFQHFLNSYSKAYNKWVGRKGSLFMHPFKRKEIKDKEYFKRVVHYIHQNPVVANLCKKPHQWQYSSYNAIISDKNTLLDKTIPIDLFDNKENFIYIHQVSMKYNEIEYFLDV